MRALVNSLRWWLSVRRMKARAWVPLDLSRIDPEGPEWEVWSRGEVRFFPDKARARAWARFCRCTLERPALLRLRRWEGGAK